MSGRGYAANYQTLKKLEIITSDQWKAEVAIKIMRMKLQWYVDKFGRTWQYRLTPRNSFVKIY